MIAENPSIIQEYTGGCVCKAEDIMTEISQNNKFSFFHSVEKKRTVLMDGCFSLHLFVVLYLLIFKIFAYLNSCSFKC